MGAVVRFGLVGTGYWAQEVHAAGIASHPGAELVGVWGRDLAKATTVASRFGARPFQDPAALFDAVDAVAFSVPPDVQANLAPQAAAAGCHLLLEKPLALSVEAADVVVHAVQRAGVSSIVFFTERFLVEREAWLDELVRAGGCHGADAMWLGSLATPGNPFAASPWRHRAGGLWDLGPHALSVVMPVLGAVSSVAGVRGRGDLVHLVLAHESGATSTLDLSIEMPPDAMRYELLFWRDDGWHRRPESAFDPLAAHRGAVGELIAMVLAGATSHRCDAAFGRDVVAVLERAQAALDEGQPNR